MQRLKYEIRKCCGETTEYRSDYTAQHWKCAGLNGSRFLTPLLAYQTSQVKHGLAAEQAGMRRGIAVFPVAHPSLNPFTAPTIGDHYEL